jgi:hypothetical protein
MSPFHSLRINNCNSQNDPFSQPKKGKGYKLQVSSAGLTAVTIGPITVQ